MEPPFVRVVHVLGLVGTGRTKAEAAEDIAAQLDGFGEHYLAGNVRDSAKGWA
jgi:hypothetical protein